MPTLLRLLTACFFGYLAFFTSAKLLKMARIRGFIDGASSVPKTITDKRVLQGQYGDAYWISWDGANIRRPSKSRLNLPEEAWRKYSVGDEFQVFFFPGDEWAYSREDVYVSNGNFVFDTILLCLWLVGLSLLGNYQRRCWRGIEPPSLPGSHQ